FKHPIFERGLEVLETVGAGGRRIDRTEEGVGRAKRNRKVLGDPLGEFARDIALSHRRNVAGVETIDGGKRQLVIDAGNVDGERGREKAIADDLVGYAWGQGNERPGESEQTRAQKTERHSRSPQLPDRDHSAAKTAASSHRQRRSARLRVGAEAG